MGAFRKGTFDYISPTNANKIEKYECPDCRKDVIFRKGSVRIPHFAHMKEDDPCHYYDKPSESQLHKDAKMLLQATLRTHHQINCHSRCEEYDNGCPNPILSWNIPKYTDVRIEYRFSYNDGYRVADVVCLDNDKIMCIFEICHTHKTNETDRPEPWYEIDATSFRNYMCEISKNEQIILKCIRKRLCHDCIKIPCAQCKELSRKWTYFGRSTCVHCHVYDKYIKPQRIYLNVPFSEKDEVKKYGGQWEAIDRKWYIMNDNKQSELIISRWGIEKKS